MQTIYSWMRSGKHRGQKKETWYRFVFADGYVSICRGMSAQELSVEEAKHGRAVRRKGCFAWQARNGRAGALSGVNSQRLTRWPDTEREGGEEMRAIIVLNGTAEEIAALALAVQERQVEDVFSAFAEKFHQEIKNRLESTRADRESQ